LLTDFFGPSLYLTFLSTAPRQPPHPHQYANKGKGLSDIANKYIARKNAEFYHGLQISMDATSLKDF